ncbi:MAG: YdcF family protein [Xanthomonadaceae bacterium]|nr:YdcF family protein [Xanthomonadaceae bacterium]
MKASQWSTDEEKELAQWGQKQHSETTSNSQRRQMMGESTADAIVREIDGLNHILRVYGEGVPPRVPDIDGPDTDNVALFKNDVSAAVMRSSLNDHDPSMVFDPSMYLSCYLLDAADRLDAIHFEHPDPNQNVMDAKPAVLWSHYPYSAILVLGVGPERQGVPLSSLSKLNVRLAADRYRKGLAPLIITSGGTVHPRRTRFAEALQMRKALIERYHIPPGAILADPHARHTTTNIRNATRLLIGFDAPLNKDVLIVSNPAHISMIESPDFRQRDMEDLGYIPGEIGKRLSPFEITFRPSTLSLRVDPRDPLDP